MATEPLTPALLLHRRPFREQSQIIDIFSREQGRLALMAHGGRERRQLLQPFQPRLLAWRGRGELPTLTAVEADGHLPLLQGDALAAGFYLNELLLRLLPRHDPQPLLYQRYAQSLQQLAQQGLEAWPLRLFERDLLAAIGYGIDLQHDATGSPLQPQQRYHWIDQVGVLPHSGAGAALTIAGATLQALTAAHPPAPIVQREARQLLQGVLTTLLGEQPLQSRELLRRPPRLTVAT